MQKNTGTFGKNIKFWVSCFRTLCSTMDQKKGPKTVIFSTPCFYTSLGFADVFGRRSYPKRPKVTFSPEVLFKGPNHALEKVLTRETPCIYIYIYIHIVLDFRMFCSVNVRTTNVRKFVRVWGTEPRFFRTKRTSIENLSLTNRCTHERCAFVRSLVRVGSLRVLSPRKVEPPPHAVNVAPAVYDPRVCTLDLRQTIPSSVRNWKCKLTTSSKEVPCSTRKLDFHSPILISSLQLRYLDLKGTRRSRSESNLVASSYSWQQRQEQQRAGGGLETLSVTDSLPDANVFKIMISKLL